jgi:hypothetical protein
MRTAPAGSTDGQGRSLLGSTGSVGSLSDGELRDSLAAVERVVNSLNAEQAEIMAEMARRAAEADARDAQRWGAGQVPHGQRTEFVADEVAVTLHCTRMTAASRYALALAAAAHPAVMRAWSSGTIDARKVQVVCDGLRGVSSPAADDLAAEAGAYAAGHTAPEVRRWLARRVIAADPGMAEIRRSRAVAGRRVSVTPLPDGVSELVALLPSVQARQVYDTVNAVAMAADADDARTMDQRRADALFDVLCGRAEPPQVTIAVTIPADTLLGEGAAPGAVAGVGPVTSGEALQLAGAGAGTGATTFDVVFRGLLTDPGSGALVDVSERQYRPSAQLERAVRARDGVCRFPGCSRSAASTRSGTDLDHTVPWPAGPTAASNLAVLCRRHHRLKHSPGWGAELTPDGVMTWTTPSGQRVTTRPWAYEEPFSDTG